MASNLELQATLTFKDKASAEIAKTLKRGASAASEQDKAIQRASKASVRMRAGMASARAETDKTTRALRQAARAAERLESTRLRGVTQGLGMANRQAGMLAQKMAAIGRGTVAAVTGGGGALALAMRKPIQYEARLAAMADTAFDKRDAAGAIAGMKELDAAVKAAVRQGGGSRDAAAEALGTMLAAGLDQSSATRLLPLVQKAATASQADANELAKILVKGIGQKQFTLEEASAAMDKAIRAGKAGQFELKDMARWLPQIISAGKGMKGMSGFDRHLANLQGIANVTGGADQAGNAYFNLLGKITSEDAANKFKDRKINLSAALAEAAQKGVDPVTAFVALIQDKVVSKNKRFRKLQKEIAATGDKDEKRALMEQAAEILQGSAVGSIIQDREAMLGLVGVMSQRELIDGVLASLQRAEGTMERSFAIMSSTSDYKLQLAENEKDIAASGLFERLKDPIDTAVSGFVRMASANESLATAAYGAATALSAIAAAGVVAGGLKALSGSGGAAAGGMLGSAGGVLGKLGKAGQFGKFGGPALLVAGGALGAIAAETDDTLTRAQKNSEHAATAGGMAGAILGAKAGAAAGTMAFPGPGTAVGTVLGGAAGYFAGDAAGRTLGSLFFGSNGAPTVPEPDPQALEPQSMRLPASRSGGLPPADMEPQTINIELLVDGETLARTVARHETATARRR